MIKKLSKSIRQYKKQTILTPVFVSFEVILEVLIPLLMSRIIDDGLSKGNMEVVYITGGILVVCAFISLACVGTVMLIVVSEDWFNVKSLTFVPFFCIVILPLFTVADELDVILVPSLVTTNEGAVLST